jgi:NADH:ubiquinone oxidoreductase subunit
MNESSSQKVADAWKAWMHFLLTDFPSLGTFITKDYEKADLKKSKKEVRKADLKKSKKEVSSHSMILQFQMNEFVCR